MFLPMLVLAALPVPVLSAHLDRWEKATAGMTSFRADLGHVRTTAALRSRQTFVGTVLWMRPNRVRMRLEDPENRSNFEEYVCDDKVLHIHDGRHKLAIEVPLPEAGGSPFTRLLFGVGAAHFRERFQVSVEETDGNIRVDIKPVKARDKMEFAHLRLILNGPKSKLAYLPSRAWLRKPTGDTEEWTFTNVTVNQPGVDAKSFEPADRPEFQRVKFPPEGGR